MDGNILKTAILEMGRQRKGEPFCPSEVVKWLYPQDWQHFMEDILSVMTELHKDKLIEIIKDGNKSEENFLPTGAVRIIIKNITNNE